MLGLNIHVDEFSLIQQYFNRSPRHVSAILGVGDDAAIWRPGSGVDLAVAADMLLVDRHFFADDDAFDIGFKALAVNISDMAAMGALPSAATLCLALPQADAAWLDRFASGFWTVAEHFGVDLIGGDTTRGSLAIAIQMWGELPRGTALRRSAACAGDDIWISGQLGGAAAGLQYSLGRLQLEGELALRCLQRLRRPQPRVALGRSLLEFAHAAIDVSDGLLSDLGHILRASQCGALVEYASLPVDADLLGLENKAAVQAAVLTGGDDYELCFTAPASCKGRIKELAERLMLPLTHIGSITPGKDLIMQGENGEQLQFERTGYNHFDAAGS